MNRCGISDIDWADYLENTASPRTRQEIESHLRACAPCRAEVESLRQADRALRIECGILRDAVDLRPVDEAAALERILAVLREHAPQTGNERLWRVRWVLALLCGHHTATKIILAADADSAPTDGRWLPVLRRLSFLTAEICGSYAGKLIWAVGQ